MDVISLFLFMQTINDVLVGVTSAALSQYYFRKSGKWSIDLIAWQQLCFLYMTKQAKIVSFSHIAFLSSMLGDINTKKICMRSFLLVNTRPASSRQVRYVLFLGDTKCHMNIITRFIAIYRTSILLLQLWTEICYQGGDS